MATRGYWQSENQRRDLENISEYSAASPGAARVKPENRIGEREQEAERCDLCGREAADVTFDYLGPDPNDPVAGERWAFRCGEDEGCNVL